MRARALEGSTLAVLLAVQGLVLATSLDRATSYDEGVYLASLDALRHGQELGGDVFASQPPGWYALLRALAFVGGDSVHQLRLAMLGLALAGTVAAWALGRGLAGPAGGLGAAALLAIAPPWPTEATRISADVPSLVLALASLALVVHASRRRSAALPVLAGALFAFAVSVKLFAATAVVALLRADRRSLALAAVGASAVGFAFLAGYADDLGSLWNGAVGFHDAARSVGPTVGDNAHRILRFLDFRTPFGWLVPLGALAALLRARATWPLWLWAAVAAGFLVWHRPLLDHHLVLLAAALSVSAGTALGAAAATAPRVAALAAAAAFVALAAGGLVQERQRLAENDEPEAAELRWAAGILDRETGPGDAVASDLPIVPYYADRRLPGDLVDTSVVRFASGSLTPAEVLAALGRDRVQAVVVGRSFRDFPGLVDAIARRYPLARTNGDLTVRLR